MSLFNEREQAILIFLAQVFELHKTSHVTTRSNLSYQVASLKFFDQDKFDYCVTYGTLCDSGIIKFPDGMFITFHENGRYPQLNSADMMKAELIK